MFALACDLKRSTKSDCLKFSDGSSKLLSGHKFQDKYVALFAEKLLLYRDIKVSLLLLNGPAATLACKRGGVRVTEGGLGSAAVSWF